MKIKDVTTRIAGLLTGDAVAFPEPGCGLIADLLDAHREQLALLEGLGSPVTLLADGPWQTARLYLRETLLHGRPAGHATASLQRAAARFAGALPLQPAGSFQRAQVLTDLAVVHRLLRDDHRAAGYAREAYWEARHAMGSLVGQEFRGELPAGPAELARLSLAGTVYDTIEWSAAAIGDPDAGRVVAVSGGQARIRLGDSPVTWPAGGDLDFPYVAYFQLLLEQVRGAEAVGPGPAPSQRVLWLRFRDTDRVERPRRPPLPPPALLADRRVVLHEIQLLAGTGRL